MDLEGFFGEGRERERAYHNIRIASSQSVKTIVDSVMHDMAVLDSKSAALLQFISVVLAALTFALGVVGDSAPFAHVIRGGLFLFMGVFGVAAWIDLRCLRSLGPSRAHHVQPGDDFDNVLLTEISQRRRMYQLALRITELTFTLLALCIALLALARAF